MEKEKNAETEEKTPEEKSKIQVDYLYFFYRLTESCRDVGSYQNSDFNHS
jgi:hypothetical protein